MEAADTQHRLNYLSSGTGRRQHKYPDLKRFTNKNIYNDVAGWRPRDAGCGLNVGPLSMFILLRNVREITHFSLKKGEEEPNTCIHNKHTVVTGDEATRRKRTNSQKIY